jgi:hypothetical protein
VTHPNTVYRPSTEKVFTESTLAGIDPTLKGIVIRAENA